MFYEWDAFKCHEAFKMPLNCHNAKHHDGNLTAVSCSQLCAMRKESYSSHAMILSTSSSIQGVFTVGECL